MDNLETGVSVVKSGMIWNQILLAFASLILFTSNDMRAWAQKTDVDVISQATLIIMNATTWPEDMNVDKKNISIGLLGSNQFEKSLIELGKKKNINVRIRVFKTLPDVRECNILIIDDNFRVAELDSRYLSSGILTVGYASNFAANGGMIGFVENGKKVAFEINANVAKKAKIKFSPDLLRVARKVH